MNRHIQKQAGFTLIEIMIVVVIIAILAGVALPSYRAQVVRTTRADAQSALLGFAQAMERHYAQNYTYGGAANGGNDTGVPAGTTFPSQAPLEGAAFYNLSIQAADATTFRLRATPIAGSRQDGDGILEINSLGRRGWDQNDSGVIEATEFKWER